MSRAGHQREHNIAVIGSGGVGKSCLTAQFVQGVFIESYDPTIEDSYRKQINVDGRHVMLEIMDTAGTEQFTSMRELYMREAQGFLLVFSITSLSSLHELTELREQILHVKNDPHVPIVLVGNKSDLEDDRRVSRSRAFALSQAWGNVPYYETSARRRINVTEAFVDVCRQIIRRDLARGAAYPSSRRGAPSRGRSGGGGGDSRRSRRTRDRYDHDEDDYEPHRRRRDRHRCVIL
ncbi:ras family-domain-containing protein [Neohortaea acidophila]|uniref:Ras-related protein RSR1 n=1 Tax=Neohortaea acidophila TaxID=245834 RepID=A0A6A6PTN2_9PEZI|nr:ras family-domain-containing protein [Neohortaea acidophila]KAF2482823.1 ras family-domain-containing protein [Neohortaea acidophila]